MDQQPSAAKSVLFLLLIGTITQVLAFCYRVALSRLIGAELLGLYQLLMSAYSGLVALCGVGLTAATSTLAAQYLALGNGRGADGVRRLAVGFFLLLLLPVSVIVFLCSDQISVTFLGDARTQLGLIFLLPCVLLTGIENIHKHFFYGAGLVKSPALTELLEQAIRAIAVLGLLLIFPRVYAERRVALIIIGMIICEVFSALTLVVLYRHWLWKHPLRGNGDATTKMRHRLLGMAIPIGANALLGNLISAANATLLPQKLVEGGLTRTDAMAQFGIICGMTLPLLSLPTVLLSSMGLVLIPRLSRSVALGRRDLERHYASRALSVVSVSMLPSMGVMAVVGGDLGVLLFQQEGADNFLFPLVLAMMVACYHATFSSILNGLCKQKTATVISILCGLLQLWITVLCVPKLGMVGYVIGVLFSSVVGAVLSGWRVVVSTGLSLGWFSNFFAPFLSTILMGLCGNLLHNYLLDCGISLLFSCGITLLFCAVLYLAALQSQGISVRQVFRLK